MELERPEDEPLPGDWKRMPEFERLLIFRTLRPDRLTAAMQRFVANTIGKEYTASQPYDLERSFQVSLLPHVLFDKRLCLFVSTKSLVDSIKYTILTAHQVAVKLLHAMLVPYVCFCKLATGWHFEAHRNMHCRMLRLAPPFLSSCPLEWMWQLVWKAWAANWASRLTLVTTRLSLWARARSPLP